MSRDPFHPEANVDPEANATTPLVIPGAPVWLRLLQDVSIREDGTHRHIPELVQTAVRQLKQIHEGAQNEQNIPQRGQLIQTLTDYRNILRRVEKQVPELPEDMAKYQGALFAYLESQRLFSDFSRFCAQCNFSRSFTELRNEAFNCDGLGFFIEMRAALRDGEQHPFLPSFVDLVVDAVKSLDRDLMNEALKFMGMLYARGELNDLKFFVDVFKRPDLNGTMLMAAACPLGYCRFIPAERDQVVLFGLGAEAARLSPKNLVGLDHPIQSEPHVEFGYNTQRILDLCYGDPSDNSHAELCKLVELIPESFFYLDRVILEKTINAIRTAVLAAIPRYADSESLLLINAASQLIEQPWKNEINSLVEACGHQGDSGVITPGALILRTALKNPHTAGELQDYMRNYTNGAMPSSSKDLKQFSLSVATLLRSERFTTDENPTLERLLRLLRKSPQTAIAVLPELLDIVGIPAVSSKPFGIISLPWSTRPDPQPLIRSLALDILFDARRNLGFFARRRLGFDWPDYFSR